MDENFDTTPVGDVKRGRRLWPVALATLVLIAGIIVVTSQVDWASVALPTPWRETQYEEKNSSNTIVQCHAATGVPLAAERLAIIVLSDDKLMPQVAAGLAERLAELDIVETVDLFDLNRPDNRPRAGERLYDLYVVLYLSEFSESGDLDSGRTIDATIDAAYGSTIWHSSVVDPAQVYIAVNASHELIHHSVTSGYEPRDRKYAKAAEGIAKSLAEKIGKDLAGWSSEYGRAGKPPAGLIPPYRPVPDDLPLPDAATLQQVMSGNGPMLNNRTIWTLRSDDPSTLLNDLYARLTDAGWRGYKTRSVNYFRAAIDDRVYEGFVARGPASEIRSNGSARVVIHYTDSMTKEQMRPVFEKMMDDGTMTAQAWLQYRNVMSKDISEKMVARLAESDKLPTEVQMAVIRHLHKEGRTEEAMKRLRQACLASLVVPDGDPASLEKLARELTGDEKWEFELPPADDLLAQGIETLKLDVGQEKVFETALGETVVFCLPVNKDLSTDEPGLLGITVTRSKIPEGRYTLYLNRWSISRSKGMVSYTPHGLSGLWECRTVDLMTFADAGLDCRAEALDDGSNRFRIKLKKFRSETPAAGAGEQERCGNGRDSVAVPGA